MSSIRTFLIIESVLELFLIVNVLAQRAIKDAGCPFKDTMNITDFNLTTDGTYDYNGIKVPLIRTGMYNYTMLVGNTKIPSDIHLRGCVCPNEILPCISLCCPPGQEYNNLECANSTTEPYPDLNITLKNQTVISKDISNHFTVQSYRVCESADAFDIGAAEYSLYEDGTLVIYPSNERYNKDQYCLNPTFDENDSGLHLKPYICSMQMEDLPRVKINSYVMLSSIPFMLITILVFIIRPEAKIQNMSMCCYLTALTVAFFVYSIINLNDQLEPRLCSALGHLLYFAFISSYAWLSVVSFHLFVNVDQNEHTEWDIFSYYSIYGWGLPSLCLAIVYILDTKWVSIPEHFRPAIGTEAYCFFANKFYNKMIYFHIPCMIFMSFNVLMLILTIRKINRITIDADSIKTKPKGIKDFIRHYMKQYGILAKLVLLTGCCWIFEVLSNIFPDNEILQYTFYLVLVQGHLIFLVFILRKKILKLIRDKFRKIFPRDELRIKTKRQNKNYKDTAM